MERAIDLIVSEEFCDLLPAMMKLDDDADEEKAVGKKLSLGVNKSCSSSIAKKKSKRSRPELKRNVWAMNLSKEKKEEMDKIEDVLQGGRDYIGVSRAPSEVVMGKRMRRFKAVYRDRRGRRVVVGTHYKSAKLAAAAHDKAVLGIYGLTTRLNFPHRVIDLTGVDENKGEGGTINMVPAASSQKDEMR